MPFARMIAQAQPAHTKAPVKRPRPTAQRAAIVLPNFELIRPLGFNSQASLGQWSSPSQLTGEGHSHQSEQHAPFLIGLRGSGNGDRHAAGFFDFVGMYLGKNNLLPQS